jgi:hypothetical protein
MRPAPPATSQVAPPRRHAAAATARRAMEDLDAARAAVQASVERASVAEEAQRPHRAAELYARSLALAAPPAFAEHSLVHAMLRFSLCMSRWNAAQTDGTSDAAVAAQLRELLSDVAAGWDVLDARRAAGTLHGAAALRPEEAAFERTRRQQVMARQAALGLGASPHPLLCGPFLDAIVPCFGYMCVLWGALAALAVFNGRPAFDEAGVRVPPALQARLQAALLRALDDVHDIRGVRRAGPPSLTNQEQAVSQYLCHLLTQTAVSGSAFGRKLLESWSRPTVCGSLMALGLRTGGIGPAAVQAAFEARAAADVAARGLHVCALPECGAREAHVAHFKRCGRCRQAVYCCPEHAAVHWRQGHKRECAAPAPAPEAGAPASPAEAAEAPLPDEAALRALPVRQLRELLAARRLDARACVEKGDMVALLLRGTAP